MLVSIIIPVYNVAPYVEQCLCSVLTQMYKDLEVIIVDDCGTDDSMEIVQRVVEENEAAPMTFRILHHEKNKGLSAARNTGIRAATGEYVYFIDSDDDITPWCIGLLVELAEKYPGVDIVQGGYCSNIPDFVKWTYSEHLFPKGKEYIGDADECRRMLQQCRHLPMVHNKLIRRAFILDNGLYNEEGIINEDNLWTFTAGRYIKDMALINAPIYYYRVRKDSIMSSLNLDKYLFSTARTCEIILSSMKLDRWMALELRFVVWRLSKAIRCSHHDPLPYMKARYRFICRGLLLLDSWRSKR